MPGLVSTLLNQAYSMPGRLVQTFLQVTEQVWKTMHLSRFSTMPICARIFILILLMFAGQTAATRSELVSVLKLISCGLRSSCRLHQTRHPANPPYSSCAPCGSPSCECRPGHR